MLQDGEKGVILQRDKQTYAIAPHVPCGLVSPELLRRIADVAERYGCTMMKITGEARIALIGLREDQIDAAWAELDVKPGSVVGLCVRGVKACPGVASCKRGMQDSLAVGLELDSKYHGLPVPGKLKLGVSGCPNQCAETAFKDIGLVGSTRGWKVLVGGCGGGRPRIGQKIADQLNTPQALELVDRLIEFFKANARPHDRMGRLSERVGLETLCRAVDVSPPDSP